MTNIITAASRSSEVIEAIRTQVTVGVGSIGYDVDIVFPRGAFTNMLLTIKSSEELGILDSAYVEDYDGLDGYMTLKRLSDSQRVSFPAVAVVGETPAIPNDVWRITVPLASVVNGFYELEGRVRDLTGNHTIFGSVATPIGGEGITTLTLEIVDGFAVQYTYQTASVSVRPTLDIVEAERTFVHENVTNVVAAFTVGFESGFE